MKKRLTEIFEEGGTYISQLTFLQLFFFPATTENKNKKAISLQKLKIIDKVEPHPVNILLTHSFCNMPFFKSNLPHFILPYFLFTEPHGYNLTLICMSWKSKMFSIYTLNLAVYVTRILKKYRMYSL